MSRIFLVVTLACLAGSTSVAHGQAARAKARSVSSPAVVASEDRCRITRPGQSLPAEIRETSGLARSRRDPNLFWTHNDSGNEPVLYALNAKGEVVARVRVSGAQLEDWEDVEAGRCETGNCLFVADIGDNKQARAFITIYKVPEPSIGALETAAAAPLQARFPDGPQDAESLFLLPSGDLFVVTKGRHGPIALYRYPAPHRPGQTVTLERVKELWPQPADVNDRVTSATASADGRWVGIRTYRTLHLFQSADLVRAGAASAATVDLRPLGEVQGESLVIADDGAVWLTSEAEKKGLPLWSRMQCELGDR